METQRSYDANVQSQVAGQMETLDKVSVSINEIVDNLEQRLASVLPKNIAGIEKKDQTQMEMVPLADNLRIYNARLFGAMTKLNDIMARCEL